MQHLENITVSCFWLPFTSAVASYASDVIGMGCHKTSCHNQKGKNNAEEDVSMIKYFDLTSEKLFVVMKPVKAFRREGVFYQIVFAVHIQVASTLNNTHARQKNEIYRVNCVVAFRYPKS